MDIEEICHQARSLPLPKQGELITRLLEEFGASIYDASDDEVSRRVEETSAGHVRDISHEKMLEGLKHP